MKNGIDPNIGDLLGKGLSIAFRLSLCLGFLVFALYLWMNKVFVSHLSINDGVLFIFLSIIFGLLHLIFIGAQTGIGNALFLLVALARLHQQSKRRNMPKGVVGRFCRRYALEAWLTFAFSMLWFLLLPWLLTSATEDVEYWTSIVVTPMLCGMLWRFYVSESAKLRIENFQAMRWRSGISASALALNPFLKLRFDLGKRRRGVAFILLMLLFAPSVFNGLWLRQAAYKSMEALGFRHPHVAIHVRGRFNHYMAEHGYTGSSSSFGPDYKKYSHFTVVLEGIGDDVILRHAHLSGSPLYIPEADVVWIPEQDSLEASASQ